MGDIVGFGGNSQEKTSFVNAEPDSSVVETLTKALEDALSGRLQLIAIVGVSNNGEYTGTFTGKGPLLTLIGAMTLLVNRISRRPELNG